MFTLDASPKPWLKSLSKVPHVEFEKKEHAAIAAAWPVASDPLKRNVSAAPMYPLYLEEVHRMVVGLVGQVEVLTVEVGRLVRLRILSVRFLWLWVIWRSLVLGWLSWEIWIVLLRVFRKSLGFFVGLLILEVMLQLRRLKGLVLEVKSMSCDGVRVFDAGSTECFRCFGLS